MHSDTRFGLGRVGGGAGDTIGGGGRRTENRDHISKILVPNAGGPLSAWNAVPRLQDSNLPDPAFEPRRTQTSRGPDQLDWGFHIPTPKPKTLNPNEEHGRMRGGCRRQPFFQVQGSEFIGLGVRDWSRV